MELVKICPSYKENPHQKPGGRADMVQSTRVHALVQYATYEEAEKAVKVRGASGYGYLLGPRPDSQVAKVLEWDQS